MMQRILWASLLVSGLLAIPAASQAVSSVSAASARLPVAQGTTKFIYVCLWGLCSLLVGTTLPLLITRVSAAELAGKWPQS